MHGRSADGAEGTGVLEAAEVAPVAPWLRVMLAPSPAPVQVVMCARGEAPRPVALTKLRGAGELPKLVGLVAREVLAKVAGA